MRNNMDRIGPEPQENTVPPNNLDFPQPTEMIDLPSKGRFYPQSHILYNVESIEMRYMTAKHEEILNSKTLLQKGVALDKMLQDLIVDKKIKLDDLFVGDKNALVLAARITGYGSDYETHVVCMSCGEKSKEVFNLNEIKPKSLQEGKITNNGTFIINLPDKENTPIELRLLTGNDEKALKMESEKKKKHNLPETPLMDQMLQMIVSVNGNADKFYIEKYCQNLRAMHSKYIRDEYSEIVPNMDLFKEFECSKCNAETKILIPFSANFFWPQR